MNLRIDEKGKYYTPHVTKNTVVTVIRTADQLIVGQVHVRPERRLKDELSDDPSRFLPVTSARVYDAAGTTLLYESGLLLVAYRHIVMISPLDTLEPATPAPWQRYVSEEPTA
jgi:hypothetical protein